LKRDELIDILQKDFENGKDEIMQTHQTARETKICPKKTSFDSVQIEIISGPHSGETYTLSPSLRKPCFIGRSTGKKFRDRGISLSKDSEVSTTHGKFEMKPGGLIFFTDTGSTNGTLHQGVELDDNVPLKLEENMELLVGSSVLKIKFKQT